MVTLPENHPRAVRKLAAELVQDGVLVGQDQDVVGVGEHQHQVGVYAKHEV